VTHTGSLVGDDRVVDAALRQAGAVRVRSLEELIVTAGVMAAAGPLRAPGIAVVSISGGSGDIGADPGDRLGLEPPPVGGGAPAEIRAVVPGFAAVQNPLDITGAALGDEFAKVLAIVDREDAFGAVAVLSNVPAYDSCKVPGITSLLDTIGTGLRSVTMPGFLLSQTIAHLNETGREAARDAALSALPGLSLGVTALAHRWRWSRPSRPPGPSAALAAHAAGLGAPPGRHAGPLSEWSARQLLEPAGVPFVPAALARTPDDAASFAAGFASPVAVKLVSPDVPHKSDIGAVRLGVAGPDDVR